MSHLNPHKAGLTLGGVFAVVHLFWSVLVAIGLAQIAMDWVFRLHFIEPPYTVAPFAVMYAVGLVVMTSIVGYVTGWVFGWLWNTVHNS